MRFGSDLGVTRLRLPSGVRISVPQGVRVEVTTLKPPTTFQRCQRASGWIGCCILWVALAAGASTVLGLVIPVAGFALSARNAVHDWRAA